MTEEQPLPEGMRWCPECNGEGEVWTMDTSPDMNEHRHDCTYPGCAEGKGIVPAQAEGTEQELVSATGNFVEVTGAFVLENGEIHIALSTLREVLPDLGWYWDEVEKRATRTLADGGPR